MSGSPHLTALVLAGRRPGPPDPMEAAEGVAHKAFIDIDGKPMIARVFETLDKVEAVSDILVAAPEDQHEALGALAREKKPRFLPASGTPATTVHDALQKVSGSLLVTTSDHPLLAPAMVNFFLRRIDVSALGAAAACVDSRTYEALYAGARRTFIRLSDFAFSGANLFWFRKETAEPLLVFWRSLEAKRKNPIAMAAAIGPGALALYAVGRLSSEGLVKTIRERTGVSARLIQLPQAEGAIDVDKPEDLDLVRRIFAARRAVEGR